jgi:stage V sporulation protein D (sporulation-specific penicillin-binding protein)
VKVDEDYRRTYPYDDLASKVLGFTGGDNQGILGLEVMYDDDLSGTNGTILTYTDVRGVEVENAAEERIEPVNGNHLLTTLDYNIQMYCTQAAEKAYLQKDADGVEIIVMNPQNGEIYAMVDYPEYNLNDPFTLSGEYQQYVGTDEENTYQNKMWRNWCVSDTYEPGSIFKTVTTAASLEEQTVALNEQFYCPGYIVVEDRRIRCHKTAGHGSEDFRQALGNSCNPVFITLGLRLGAERYYNYMKQFGLFRKTGIDLPGEAATIMHSLDAIGEVELATMSFGQSFQVTPIQMATTVSSLVNGGHRVTPHLGKAIVDDDGNVIKEFTYEQGEAICSQETSATMRELLQYVVEEGGGSKAYIEGYEIGGKTATSQTLPRSEQKYIASFIGFSPASDPNVLVMVIIRNPSGVYYGGTIAAPVAREIFENILPYLE